MIKNVFLDLDDTIFDFHKAEAIALCGMLGEFGVAATEDMTKRYSEINLAQWKKLELGLATRDEVLTDRFTIFFSEIGLDIEGKAAREIYEHRLSIGHYFIDGAKELLENLYGKYRLYLASNGTLSVQTGRIASSGIEKYFDGIFISQKIGYDKPSREYFLECFKQIPDFIREETVIIGDSLSSDIKGGKNAGIKTCLFNPKNKELSSDIKPDYEVKSLYEIPSLLCRI